MQKKGFIAAPLLGTLVFLVCILVIINFSSSEESAVSETVSNAYHNRLVSLVEIYRSDLGSVFNIGIQRNIEYGLASQCWYNFLPIHTESDIADSDLQKYDEDPVVGNYDGILDEKEERKYLCERSSEIIKQVVCSRNTTYLFGIASWANIISEQKSFEGIALRASNEQAFLNLIGYGAGSTDPTNLCESLISGVELNCNAFAQGNYECCSEKNPDGSCKSVVPGCETGKQFFIRISVQNDQVFSKFPRVFAADSAGNRIRAGAITDTDFDAPVNYPFFKYLDAAFTMNKYFAFGKNLQNDRHNGGGAENGASRGVVDGSCIGKSANCKSLITPKFSVIAGDVFGSDDFNSGDDAKSAYATAFLGAGSILDLACKKLKEGPYKLNTTFEFYPSIITCEDIVANPANNDYMNNFEIKDLDSVSDPSKHVAFANALNLQIRLVDPDNTTQVDAQNPNQFCWRANPSFDDGP